MQERFFCDKPYKSLCIVFYKRFDHESVKVFATVIRNGVLEIFFQEGKNIPITIKYTIDQIPIKLKYFYFYNIFYFTILVFYKMMNFTFSDYKHYILNYNLYCT